MSSSGVAEEVFTFIWRIENLHLNAFKNGEVISSPAFNLPNFQSTKWCVELCPNGVSLDSNTYISCFLNRKEDDGPEKIDIKYYFDLHPYSEVKEEEIQHIFCKKAGYGFSKLMSSDLITKAGGELIVTCEMRFSNPNFPDVSSNSKTYLSTLLESKSQQNSALIKGISEKVEKKALQMVRSLLAVPRICVARSQLCFERSVMEWPVETLFMDGSESQQVIPVVLSKHSFVILLSKDSNDGECISITLEDINTLIKGYLVVACRVSVHVNDAEFICLPEEKLILQSAIKKWTFEGSIKNSDLQNKLKENPMNSLSWGFEFKFASNEVHSEILWEECTNTPCDPDKSMLSQQFSLLSMDLSDVVLKVTEKSFPAHKAVLAAMSPVFAAMFRSDMTESATNTVTIEDFDDDVVGQLVAYFYSGAVEGLDFNRALQLFAVADKYQVLPLKKLCRGCLIENIDDENVCEVLSLADKCNDEKLRKASVRFLSYSSDVFNSDEWATFEKDNVTFAIKTLKEVFLPRK